jgi:hypothetical protein
MSITLLAGNLIESAAFVNAPAASGYDAAALSDNASSPSWVGTTPTPTVGVDFGAARTVSGWGIVAHNLAGGTMTVQSSPDAVTWTPRAIEPISGASTAFARPFSVLASARYWQFVLPAPTVSGPNPIIGELILAEAVTLPTPQVPPGYSDRVLGNVRRDYSPAGYSWAVKRGASRREFKLAYAAMDLATLALLRSAYAACDEGARKFAYVDADGVSWWVEWMEDTLEATVSAAVYDGLLGRAVASVTLREAL